MSSFIANSSQSVAETSLAVQIDWDLAWSYPEGELLSILSERSTSPYYTHVINTKNIAEKIIRLNEEVDFYRSLYKSGWDPKWFNYLFKEKTLIQKMIREGEFEFLQELAPHFTQDELHLSPHFTQDEFRECLANPPSEPLSQMSIDPILVAQQGCTSIVRLKEGKNLRLPATKALELRKRILKENRINPESRRADHVFTIYMNRNHASYSLKARGVFSGREKHYGFYPAVEPLTPFSSTSCAVIDDRMNSLDSSHTNELMLQIPITNVQRESLQNYADVRRARCENGTDSYLPLGRNCVDFVQGGFESAGFPGHFGELIEPKKLASKIKGTNGKHGLAAQYTFARVMGLAAFFLAQFTAFEFSDDYATRKILYVADLVVAGLTLYLLYKCMQKTSSCCSRIAKAIPSKVGRIY